MSEHSPTDLLRRHRALTEFFSDGKEEISVRVRRLEDNIRDLESELDEELWSPSCDGSGAPAVRKKLRRAKRDRKRLMAVWHTINQCDMMLLIASGDGGDIRRGPDGRLYG